LHLFGVSSSRIQLLFLCETAFVLSSHRDTNRLSVPLTHTLFEMVQMRFSINIFTIALMAITLSPTLLHADTTQTGTHVYEVNAGVTFSLHKAGTSSWLWSWTDTSGTFSNIQDPTIILTAGETYTFDNFTSIHPFGIADDTLPVAGTDGNFFRTTTSMGVITAAILDPFPDFVANPAPQIDDIVWSPTNAAIGTYYYTCLITFHTGMVGQIRIVAGAPTCQPDLTGDGQLNFFDVSAFLSAFAAMDPVADFNADGQFNFFDVSAFLASFSAGCP